MSAPSIAQYAARAEAAEAKIAELTSLAAQIQAVAGSGVGAAASGDAGIGEFKAYFLEKLKGLRAQVVEEHNEFLAEKTKNAEAQKEIAKLRFRVETLTREFAARLGTPVPEDIFKDEPKEAAAVEEKGEKEKDKKKKDKEKDKDGDKEKDKKKKDKDGEKDKEKDKKKKDKDGEKGEKEKDKKKEKEGERKPSEKAAEPKERKPSERKQSEKAEPKERKPSEKAAAAEPVVVHTEQPKKDDKGKKDNKKDAKKEEKPKKDSTRTESEKGEPKKEEPKKDAKKDAKKEDAGKKDGGKKDAKKDGKKEEPKAEAKAEAKAPGGLDDKAVKACLKEGGKKGQDCAGMATFGTHFFCVTIESAEGNMKLLEKVLEGMNVEVDEAAEDRKGGAGDLGKILFNANEQKLVILCHTPTEVTEKATAKEWMAPVLAATGAKVVSENEHIIQAELDNDPDAGIYALKLRDQGISASFEFLRSKGLMIDDDSEEENYAAAAGINLNAAPGADY